MSLFSGRRVSVLQDGKTFEMDDGVSNTTLYMYLVPLNFVLKND